MNHHQERRLVLLYEELARAQRAFHQNPTPALSTSIKQILQAIKTEEKKHARD